MFKYQKNGLFKALSMLLVLVMILTTPLGTTQAYALEDEQTTMTDIQDKVPLVASEETNPIDKGVNSSDISGVPDSDTLSEESVLPTDVSPLLGTLEDDTNPPAFAEGKYPKNYSQEAGSRQFNIMGTAAEAANFSAVFVVDGDTAPTKEQVRNGQNASGNIAIRSFFSKGKSTDISIVGFVPLHSANYDVYVVLSDDAGNLSEPAMVDLLSPPPADLLAFDYPQIGDDQPDGSKQAQITLQIQNIDSSKNGKVYWVLLPDGATAPSIEQVAAGTDGDNATAITFGSPEFSPDYEASFLVTGAAGAMAYDLYLVVGNTEWYSPLARCTDVKKLDITTPADIFGEKVCALGDTEYETLTEAVDAAGSTATIRLLKSFTSVQSLTITNKNITFDLNGQTLNITTSADEGLKVNNGTVALTGIGELNVSGKLYGVWSNKSNVTVTNASASGTGVFAMDGSKVTVLGDADGTTHGVRAEYPGTEVLVEGNVSNSEQILSAVYSANQAKVVVQGEVTSARGYGVHAAGGSITVNDNVDADRVGAKAEGTNSEILITGDISCYSNGAIISSGNGTITVEGEIKNTNRYIGFGTNYLTKEQGVTDSTKPGYLKYSDSSSNAGVVWVNESVKPVCEIGGTQYETIGAALAAIGSGETKTIKLLQSINQAPGINIEDGRNITFDLNGYTLNIDNPAGAGLSITDGTVDYIGSGEFNVSGGTLGVMVNGTDAHATVTNATGVVKGVLAMSGTITVEHNVTATGLESRGINVEDGGSITVYGDVQGQKYGAYADGTDSTIIVTGDVSGIALNSWGVYAVSGGDVTVGGTASGSRCGIGVSGADSKVLAKNAIATPADGIGVSASGGTVVITGDATGGSNGVNAYGASTITIAGNIRATAIYDVPGSSGCGAVVSGATKITVEGTISAAVAERFIRFGTTTKSEADWTLPTTKEGYRTYTDGISFIWVNDTPLPTVTYNTTVNGSYAGDSGAGSYAQNAAVTINAGSRSNYGFAGWTSMDGVTFANKNSAATTFTMPAKAVTVTANWIYRGDSSGNNGGSSGGGSSGGSNSGSTTAPTIATDKKPNQPVMAAASVASTLKTKGFANANIPDKTVTDAIAKSQADAKAQGKSANGIGVSVTLRNPTNTNSLDIVLSQPVLKYLTDAKVQKFEINGQLLTLILNHEALQEIRKQSIGDVTINLTPAIGLSKKVQAVLGTRPVYNITFSYVKNGKTVIITSLNKGSLTLSIPYTPGNKEVPGYLYAVYVDGKGKAIRIAGSTYDENSKSILFLTNYFSVYGVGYTAPSSNFTDISSYWAKESIDYVVGYGLISGTSKTSFSPNTAMTRGILVTALGRLAVADVSGFKTSSFTDVTADKYYAPYIEWAYQKGIMQSIDSNRFAPDSTITREEVAMIFENYAKATGYTLPVTREVNTYADASSISINYKTVVKTMQQAGIMMGEQNNRFNPKANVTRAEVSSMLHRYIKLTIDPATAQGWALNDDGQYFYYKDGKTLTGWLSNGVYNNKRYYFTMDGIMVTGKWLMINGKWYYFNADGALAINTKIDGYEVDANGMRKTK